ncbi:MAG: branched-chain amino acid transport system substrate-binding protein [Acetobacteraceae bacterium]|jgi:branched-chain amino acid transport system substrate-binding protein|nr:Extracellular ligand-binding receptor [Rhodopila sp.]MEA2729010.1 branched-chain amino acid transport system substrate-binding protein [Acetobacteraceae bacterium]
MTKLRGPALGLAALVLLPGLLALPASAQKTVVGVTDTEIKIGQTAPFSGPASAYGQISTAETDYFKMINDQGGINGRKINLIALDDGYSPPKSIEAVRRLIEEDQVAIMFQTIGTAPNAAIRKYINQKKVPDIWLGSGASMFVTDPAAFPWSIPFQPSYRLEGQMYAKYILEHKPNAKIGIIYQNDDLGRDYVNGLKDGLGDKFDKMVLKSLSYEVADPTIDSQILQLQASGADVLYDASTPKFAAMTIRKVADIDWHPLHIIDSNGALVKPALESAGLDKSVGVLTAQYLKDPTDPGWADDAGMKEFQAWRAKYAPESDPANPVWAYGYTMAQALVVVLKQAGNDLSRENIMKAATSLPDTTKLPMVLPGIKISTSPTDYRPMKSMRLGQFDGKMYQLLPEE